MTNHLLQRAKDSDQIGMGMIGVDSVLYMCLRPDNSFGSSSWEDHFKKATLYQSKNKGKSWEPASWEFTKEDGIIGG